MAKKFTTAQLTKAGFIKRTDLDFSDDGSRFRCFEFEGIIVSYTKWTSLHFLAVRVDYRKNNFTFREWMDQPEYELCDEFNDCEEIDVEKLIENIRKIKAAVERLENEVENEELPIDEMIAMVDREVAEIEEVICKVREIDWLSLDKYKLDELRYYAEILMKRIDSVSSIDYSNRYVFESFKGGSILDYKYWAEQIEKLLK